MALTPEDDVTWFSHTSRLGHAPLYVSVLCRGTNCTLKPFYFYCFFWIPRLVLQPFQRSHFKRFLLFLFFTVFYYPLPGLIICFKLELHNFLETTKFDRVESLYLCSAHNCNSNNIIFHLLAYPIKLKYGFVKWYYKY